LIGRPVAVWFWLGSGTPGPVVVELTADVCSQMVPVAAQTYMSPVLTRSVPEASMIAEAAKALLAAEKPMIWAGAGVLASDATAELKELAELIATPVFTTMPGKSAIDEDHPLALGAGVGTTTLPAYRWLNESDVMIALGSSLTRTPYGQHLQGRRAAKFKIHNTVNPDDVNSEEYANIALVGDTKLCIIALIEEIKAQTGGAGKNSNMDTVSAEVAKLKALWLKEWESVLQSDEEPISYYRVIHGVYTVHAPRRPLTKLTGIWMMPTRSHLNLSLSFSLSLSPSLSLLPCAATCNIGLLTG
jgi:acetolactate synthase-1/2/3 large subunit